MAVCDAVFEDSCICPNTVIADILLVKLLRELFVQSKDIEDIEESLPLAVAQQAENKGGRSFELMSGNLFDLNDNGESMNNTLSFLKISRASFPFFSVLLLVVDTFTKETPKTPSTIENIHNTKNRRVYWILL